MQVHEFYGKYANVPLSDRLHILNFKELSLTSLAMVYQEVNALEAQIRPLEIRQQYLIDQTEKFILEHQAGKETPHE